MIARFTVMFVITSLISACLCALILTGVISKQNMPVIIAIGFTGLFIGHQFCKVMGLQSKRKG